MLNKFKGCLLGLAVGDALGAPVEFLTMEEIRGKFGPEGVVDYGPWGRFQAGSYTDDTQLSLATAIGCIKAFQKWKRDGQFQPSVAVYKSYLDWLKTQERPSQRRSAGKTCLEALQSGQSGTLEVKINNSKGSGAVMRMAPVGLAYPSNMAFREGAEYGVLTHGHPSGYLTAGFLSELIARLVEGKSLAEAVEWSAKRLQAFDKHEETLAKIEHARVLLFSQRKVPTIITELGGGWTGEEALAIALYCAMKFSDDFKQGVLAAVNHSGDSDTTGSLTGAILGTLLGIEAIPERWSRGVENSRLISALAEDMYKLFKKGEELPRDKYPPD